MLVFGGDDVHVGCDSGSNGVIGFKINAGGDNGSDDGEGSGLVLVAAVLMLLLDMFSLEVSFFSE